MGIRGSGMDFDVEELDAFLQLKKKLGTDLTLYAEASTNLSSWEASGGIEWRF